MKIKIPQATRLRDFEVVGSMYRQPRVKVKTNKIRDKQESTRRL